MYVICHTVMVRICYVAMHICMMHTKPPNPIPHMPYTLNINTQSILCIHILCIYAYEAS
jgi:hypothetical protein